MVSKSQAAVERERRRVALLDLEMHAGNAPARERVEMTDEQRARMAPPRASVAMATVMISASSSTIRDRTKPAGFAARPRNSPSVTTPRSASSRSNSRVLQRPCEGRGMDGGEPRRGLGAEGGDSVGQADG